MVVNLLGPIYSATLFTFRGLTMPGHFFILRSQGTRMQILPSIRLNQGHPRSHSSSGSRPRLECIIHIVTGTLAWDFWRSHHCCLLERPPVWPRCWKVWFLCCVCSRFSSCYSPNEPAWWNFAELWKINSIIKILIFIKKVIFFSALQFSPGD